MRVAATAPHHPPFTIPVGTQRTGSECNFSKTRCAARGNAAWTWWRASMKMGALYVRRVCCESSISWNTSSSISPRSFWHRVSPYVCCALSHPCTSCICRFVTDHSHHKYFTPLFLALRLHMMLMVGTPYQHDISRCLHRNMGWLRWAGFFKLKVSFAEYSLFYRALLQKRPIILLTWYLAMSTSQ